MEDNLNYIYDYIKLTISNSILNGNIIGNINNLSKFNIESISKQLGKTFIISHNKNIDIKNLIILDSYISSLDYLILSKCSLSRFGDGEIRIMYGDNHQFNKKNLKLQKLLFDTLKNPDEKLLLALPSTLFNIIYPNNYWNNEAPKLKQTIIDYIDFNKVYLNANMTLYFSNQKNDFGDKYFNKFRSIWEKKDIILVTNIKLFKTNKYNIFDNTNNIFYIDAPASNAIDVYDELMTNITKHSNEKLIILILGMTATVMANHLSKLGYRALDLGHLAKSYSIYKEGINVPKDFFKN